MKALARILAFPAVRNLRIQQNMKFKWSFFALVFNVFLKFQVIIDDNSEQFNLSGVVNSSIHIFDKKVFCLSPRIISWIFLGFACRELIWNQLNTFLRPYLSTFLSELCNVLSSAKLQTCDFTVLKNKLLINIWKRSGPSIELRDTSVCANQRTEGWCYHNPLLMMGWIVLELTLNWFRLDYNILT